MVSEKKVPLVEIQEESLKLDETGASASHTPCLVSSEFAYYDDPTPSPSLHPSLDLSRGRQPFSSDSFSTTLTNTNPNGSDVQHENKQVEVFSLQSCSSPSSSHDLEVEGFPSAATEPPHHVFTQSQKKGLLCIVSLAGVFSPLSSNIYFPALGEISKELHVSMSLASLTITAYMLAQAIAPSFWGSLSDSIGRRPVFIGTFIVYVIANIALALSKNYVSVMILRVMQAMGSAATVSIGAGVIGDITTSAERGGLIGAFGGIRMLGQAFGPALGGILTQYSGYVSIFWFLTAFGVFTLLIIVLLLPETLRSIAGNGAVHLSSWLHKPVIYLVTGQPHVQYDAQPNEVRSRVKWLTVFASLVFLMEKDVFITLLFGSIVYTIWSMVTSTTTALFLDIYRLDALQIGLTFLANGAGCVCGSFTMGWLMDRDHKRTEIEYCKQQQESYEADKRITIKTHEDFPIERARLRNNWWILAIFVITTASYGFSLSTHLALPVILQFLIAFTATAVFSVNSALVIDLYPGKSASATAVNNLMRCSLGSVGVAVAQPIIDALTPKYAFLLLAGIAAMTAPLVLLELKCGPGWRMNRNARRKIAIV